VLRFSSPRCKQSIIRHHHSIGVRTYKSSSAIASATSRHTPPLRPSIVVNTHATRAG
jgi:hypothetical protein